MYRNGVRIGLEITLPIHRQTRQDQIVGHTACTVVAAGTSSQGTAECRIATTAHPTAGTTTLASASAFQLVNRELLQRIENRE